jgi:cell wall-associated NlpC family hydrolase
MIRRASRRRPALLTSAAACAAALCLGIVPAAHADDPSTPSRDDVRAAQQQVETTAEVVDQIKAELEAAEQAVREQEVEAAKAVEAYNGSVYELEQSRSVARRAKRSAQRAATGVQRMSDLIADAVVGDVMDGGLLTDLGVLLQSDPDALMDEISSYRSYTGAMASRLDEFDAARVLADVLVHEARAAVRRQEVATDRMAAARRAAQRAVAAADAAADQLEQRRDELVVQLAQARDISVQLARQRQEALAEQAAEAARLLAEQQAQDQADREAARAQRLQAHAEALQAKADDAAQLRARAEEPTGSASPPLADPASSRGVEAAVRFALAQVGEPYVWAAAGPRSWDCSGLTMAAWAAGGKTLPHYSVAQYETTTPVSLANLRRGDLLFWSDGGPSSIFHVALYLGDGMMVHAPRTGRNVEVVSMYYWITPDLVGRP